MPDPILYVKAMAAAAAAGVALALVVSSIRRPAGAGRINTACVLGMAAGLIAGYWVLDLLPRELPQNVLDRFLMIILPAVIAIELVAGFHRVPRWVVWILRVGLTLATPRILLHGSRYLSDAAGDASAALSLSYAGVGGGVLAAVWGLLAWLVRRSPGVSLPLVVSETSLFGGLAVMLSAYPSGGEAALPLAAALAAVAGVLWFLSNPQASMGAIGIGVVGLFGVLFAGRFFGSLSTERALAVFFTPLLCWLTELPPLRKFKPWQVAAIRIALAAIPLVIVVALAKRDFDRSMEANSGYAAAKSTQTGWPGRPEGRPGRASDKKPRHPVAPSYMTFRCTLRAPELTVLINTTRMAPLLVASRPGRCFARGRATRLLRP